MRKPVDTSNVFYTGTRAGRLRNYKTSISVIGIDTEADRTGACFMIATSEGDVFKPEDFPSCMFSRRYRNQKFVAYNLKYDEGALLQFLPMDKLDTLRVKDACEHDGFKVSVIPHKMLSISRGKNAVTFYDMLNFYQSSLDAAAKKILGKSKIDLDPELFTPEYIADNWELIAEYCKKDAQLVCDLAEHLIRKFETFGVYPRALYSVAHISYQHFRRVTSYPTVGRYWEDHRYVLDLAMGAYNGGKFEVTVKGRDYYYEYDIVSAYPYEIRNLIDISHARIVREPRYRRQAVYGFVKCRINIPFGVYSPTVVKRGYVNCYPIGEYERVITKAEYEYLAAQGCDLTIKDAVWLHVAKRQFPFRDEIDKLIIRKQKAKETGDQLDYHTVKILMNSLYGKFVQLIETGGKWRASACWNPIYGAVITANVRIRISNLQQIHDSIVAVHTDSVISNEPLPYAESNTLGDLSYECEGEGLILGSGVYQIGDKVAFRGYSRDLSLIEITQKHGRRVTVPVTRPITWREAAHRNMPHDMINRFTDQSREIDLNFDKKRLWLDDWETWDQVHTRLVKSLPLVVCRALF